MRLQANEDGYNSMSDNICEYANDHDNEDGEEYGDEEDECENDDDEDDEVQWPWYIGGQSQALIECIIVYGIHGPAISIC